MIRITTSIFQLRAASGFAQAGWAAAGRSTAPSIAVSNRGAQMTEFAYRASRMKSRFRGKGQYAFARQEAQRFLDSEVPKSNVSEWLESGMNAVALSQVLRFFEVEADSSLASMLISKLVRTAEDSTQEVQHRLEATLSLVCARPEENYERAFSTVEDVLKGDMTQRSISERWSMLDLCARILQRCGKRVPTALSDHLTHVAMLLLQVTPQADLPSLQPSLLRIYSWLVRAERQEASSLLFVLTQQSGDFRSHDFGTLILTNSRHHQLSPLPVEVIKQLARTGLQYTNTASGRDVAAILGSTARMLTTLGANVNGVTTSDINELGDQLNALLEDYQPRVLRFMKADDALYWQNAEDVTTICFAYELGGHLRYHAVFAGLHNYAENEAQRFEPQQIAMATGILRRSQLLTPELSDMLSRRIETVLGEFNLAELSHICATFATLATPPSWMEEAKSIVIRLLTPETPGSTRLNLALAFPKDESFAAQVDYSQISGRQLVDSLSLANASQMEDNIMGALTVRLSEGRERFSPDDIRALMASGRPLLMNTANEYLRRRFHEATWCTDTLFCLPLAVHSVPGAKDPVKALAAAQAASVSPEQFVCLVEVLTSCFGEEDDGITGFAISGGEDLLSAQQVTTRTLIRYLAAVKPFPRLQPNQQWLNGFVEKCAARFNMLSLDEIESLLISCHSIFQNVGRTPIMQQVISAVVEGPFQRLQSTNAQAARITVLLAHLQQGVLVPLLTEKTPLVGQIQLYSSSYPPDIADAVKRMPLPAATTEVKRGRFTLKHVQPQPHTHHVGLADTEEGDRHRSALSLDLTAGDPFECSPTAAVPDAMQPLGGSSAGCDALNEDTSGTPVQPQQETTPEVVAGEQRPSTAEVPHSPSAVAEPPVQHTSYFAKFFSSSEGPLFRRHKEAVPAAPKAEEVEAVHTNSTDTPSLAHAAEVTSSPGPRRTNLRASTGSSTRFVTPSLSSDQPARGTGWGTPPTFSTEPSQQQNMWGVPLTSPTPADSGAATLPPADRLGAPTGLPLFSDPFLRGGNPPPPMPPQSAYATPQLQKSSPPTPTFGSLFHPSKGVVSPTGTSTAVPTPALPLSAQPVSFGGHNVFYNPAEASRPRSAMITKRAVPNRIGVAPTNTDSPAVPTNGGYSLQAPESASGTPPPFVRGSLTSVVGQRHASATSVPPRAGITRVMGKATMRAVVPPPQVAPQPAHPIDTATPQSPSNEEEVSWLSARRNLGRISRAPKNKSRTRSQVSLSDWLNTPTSRFGKEDEPTSKIPHTNQGRRGPSAKTAMHEETHHKSGKGRPTTKAAKASSAPSSTGSRGGGKHTVASSPKHGKKESKRAQAPKAVSKEKAAPKGKKAPAKHEKTAPASRASKKTQAKPPKSAGQSKPANKPAAAKQSAASKKAPPKKGKKK